MGCVHVCTHIYNPLHTHTYTHTPAHQPHPKLANNRRWKPDARQDMEYVFFKMDFRPPAFQPCCMSFKVGGPVFARARVLAPRILRRFLRVCVAQGRPDRRGPLRFYASTQYDATLGIHNTTISPPHQPRQVGEIYDEMGERLGRFKCRLPHSKALIDPTFRYGSD